MVLPERTVDAWVATYITGRYWRARLWAPTERPGDGRYDLGVGLGHILGDPTEKKAPGEPEKLLALEHKGVYENPKCVRIRLGQLADHLADDHALGGQVLFYVLPNPPWDTSKLAPPGHVPGVANHRLRAPGRDGFQGWAWVVSVADLSTWLHQAWPGHNNPDYFFSVQTHLLSGIPGALNLRDFLTEVAACRVGQTAAALRSTVTAIGGATPRGPEGETSPPAGEQVPPDGPPSNRPTEPEERLTASEASYRLYVSLGVPEG